MSYAREMDSPAFIYIFLGLYGIFHIKIWLLKNVLARIRTMAANSLKIGTQRLCMQTAETPVFVKQTH